MYTAVYHPVVLDNEPRMHFKAFQSEMKATEITQTPITKHFKHK